MSRKAIDRKARTLATTSSIIKTSGSSVLQNTSVPGFDKISSSESTRTRKIAWAILLVIVFLVCFIHLIVNLFRYLQVPVNTTTDYDQLPFIFPDVTFCLTNAFSLYKFLNHSIPVGGTKSMKAEHMYYSIENFWKVNMKEYSDLPLNKYTRDVASLARASATPYALTYNLTHEAQEVILQCKYRGNPCSFRDFTTILLPKYLKCFTFAPTQREISADGPDSGLYLILHVGDRLVIQSGEELLKYLRGVHVMMHTEGTMPSFEVYDTAQIGHYTKISMGLTKNVDVNRKGSKCSSKLSHYSFTMLGLNGTPERNYTYKYSKDACIADAIQREFVEKCSCFSENYIIPTDLSGSGTNYCHHIPENAIDVRTLERSGNNVYFRVDNETTIPYKEKVPDNVVQLVLNRHSCEESVRYKINITRIRRSCRSLCINNRYGFTSSAYRWPEVANLVQFEALRFADKLVNDSEAVGLSSEVIQGRLIDQAKTRENQSEFWQIKLSQLQIYPRVGIAIVIAESPDYPITNYLADIGGILGLWIGFSIMTIAELIDGILVGIANGKHKRKINNLKELLFSIQNNGNLDVHNTESTTSNRT